MVREDTRHQIAVAVHGIEPATFDRCALIRDWLADHGVDRVTLLVIPARDLHPLADRRPELASWLLDCERGGDEIAQHGFQHSQASGPRRVLARLRGDEAEFVGLDPDDTRRAVDAGRRVLKLAGIEPRGFVAPAYAYAPALRAVLSPRFDWWAGRWRVHGRPHRDRSRLGPPPRIVPAALGALSGGRTLRLDVRPADLTATGRMLALEAVLMRARGRRAITYEELAR